MGSKLRLIALITGFAFTVVALLNTQSAAQGTQPRTVRPVSISGDLTDLNRAHDERDFTRANAGTPSYAKLSITLDLGEEHNVVGVIQDHGRWAMQYPGAYRVEVAGSLGGRWDRVFEGPGQRGESRATFEAVRGRYVRITATDERRGVEDWSIAEVRVMVDPGATPRRSPWGDRDRDRDRDRDQDRDRDRFPDRNDRPLRDVNLAFDKNLNTRATSGVYDYAGTSVTLDLEGEYELSRVIQLHGQWQDDYPAEYKIEVSRDRNEGRFREVFRGAGEPGRSIAQFATVSARYVRITALRGRDRYHWWSIAEVRTNRDSDADDDDENDRLTPREIQRVTAQGISNASAIVDGRNATRATTNNVNYAGSWIELDLGGIYTVSRVVQIHDPDERDYPGRYRIEISNDGNRWREVFQGQGDRGRSAATFNPVRTRFLRITAISNHDLQHWWSIYKLKIRG
jgi:hypothetical protein